MYSMKKNVKSVFFKKYIFKDIKSVFKKCIKKIMYLKNVYIINDRI
jgi:hypothetical protein